VLLALLAVAAAGCRRLARPALPALTVPASAEFEDVTEAAGLKDAGGETCAWGDYDDDGYADLMAGKGIFHNHGDGTFTHVPEGPQGEGIWADFDNDGDLDLFAANRLYRNPGRGNRWVKVTVRGGGGSNAAAIGAGVRVTAGALTQIREVCGGNSGNQDPLALHFGLGRFSDKVTVEVFYPSGRYVSRRVWPCAAYTFAEREARKHPPRR